MFSDYSQRMRQATAVIGPYRASDHAAVYDVCVRRRLEVGDPGETTVTYLGRALEPGHEIRVPRR